jgi:hypothetical protein
MAETKWTPGPWRVDMRPTGHPEIRAESRRVAYLDLRGDLSAVDANANLIAAAPDLAHTVKEAWRDLEDILTSNVVGGHPDIDDQTRRDLQATADALYAALAKAEGREPRDG